MINLKSNLYEINGEDHSNVSFSLVMKVDKLILSSHIVQFSQSQLELHWSYANWQIFNILRKNMYLLGFRVKDINHQKALFVLVWQVWHFCNVYLLLILCWWLSGATIKHSVYILWCHLMPRITDFVPHLKLSDIWP